MRIWASDDPMAARLSLRGLQRHREGRSSWYPIALFRQYLSLFGLTGDTRVSRARFYVGSTIGDDPHTLDAGFYGSPATDVTNHSPVAGLHV